MEASAKNKEKAERKKREKAEKEAKKAKNRAEREAAAAKKAAALSGEGGSDKFGNLPLIKSEKISDKVWTEIGELDSSKAGAKVTIRGHLQTVRGMGKGVFAVVRSSLYTVQCVAFESKDVPKLMVEFINKIASEVSHNFTFSSRNSEDLMQL